MERESPALRIGELSLRTGVSVATLRAWERRYRVLRPSRTAGGQRLYSVDDEARVREVERLVDQGIAVGAAARWVAERETGDLPAMPQVGLTSADVDGHSAARGYSPERRRASLALAEAPSRVRASAAGRDDDQAVAVHEVTRAMLHATAPADVVAVLAGYVRSVGGSLVDAQIDDSVLPVDLSFGLGEPRLPRADPMSVARLRLEQDLPALVEDARRVIDLLRRAGAGDGPPA